MVGNDQKYSYQTWLTYTYSRLKWVLCGAVVQRPYRVKYNQCICRGLRESIISWQLSRYGFRWICFQFDAVRANIKSYFCVLKSFKAERSARNLFTDKYDPVFIEMQLLKITHTAKIAKAKDIWLNSPEVHLALNRE